MAIQFSKTLIYVFVCNYAILVYLKKSGWNGILFLFKSIFWCCVITSTIFFSNNLGAILAGSRLGGQTNGYGMCCAFAALIGFYLIKYHYVIPSDKWLWLLGFLFAIVFILLSGSRKALLYFLIPISFFLIFRSKGIAKTLRNFIVVIVLIFIVYLAIMKVPILYESIGRRVATLLNFINGRETDSSTATRAVLVSDGIEMFRRKPWIGYGLGNFSTVHSLNSTIKYYAHNNYIELLVDVGIIGTLMYYSLNISTIIRGLRKIKYKDPLLLLLFGYLIGALICEYGNVTYYATFDQLLYAIVWYVFRYYRSN
ncbi:O-antigen ligase family protein [Galactobacillus timonensis]|uniref:O-antigen ligase family protein n=1 Tax=Galactobacillus timonensis TaxID=2041840 RepID=UPI001AEC01BB|nr:O-antigen ligase family protein [Galactobacillus timonensis]